MESQPQNPEFRIKPENFHPWTLNTNLCNFACYHMGLVARKPGPEAIKLFSYSTQLSTKFILLINVKMPTIFGILTFISMINATSERLKARNFFICRYLVFMSRCEICYACNYPVTWEEAHWCGWWPCTCTLIKNPIMMMSWNFMLSWVEHEKSFITSGTVFRVSNQVRFSYRD